MRRLLFERLMRRPLTEAAPTRDDAALKELGRAFNRAARQRLGRSLAIREVDAGSCNGCELEIHALTTPSTISNASASLRRLAAPCRRADGDWSGDQEHARGAGTHLQCNARSQMGCRCRQLRVRWWDVRWQLCGCGWRVRRDPGRSAHQRLPTQSHGALERTTRVARNSISFLEIGQSCWIELSYSDVRLSNKTHRFAAHRPGPVVFVNKLVKPRHPRHHFVSCKLNRKFARTAISSYRSTIDTGSAGHVIFLTQVAAWCSSDRQFGQKCTASPCDQCGLIKHQVRVV